MNAQIQTGNTELSKEERQIKKIVHVENGKYFAVSEPVGLSEGNGVTIIAYDEGCEVRGWEPWLAVFKRGECIARMPASKYEIFYRANYSDGM